MIGLGIAAASLSTFATGIESANVVGYTTSTLEAGKYSLISLPFAGVDGGNQKLTEAMSGSWFGGETNADGDNLRVWNPADQSYTVYYYYTDDTHEWDGWYDVGGAYYFDDCAENAEGLEAGWTAWYQSRGTTAPTVTMAGAVESADDVSVTVYGGVYTLLANPFPVRMKLNDATQVNWGAAKGGETNADGDNIRVWTAADQSYTIYYYYTDDSHEWDGWYDVGGAYYFEDVPETDNANGLQVGEVFWYQSRDAKGTNHTITFFNPT